MSTGDGDFFARLWHLLAHADAWSLASIAVRATAILALPAVEQYLPRLPSALIVLVLGIAASYLLRLDQHGVDVVGKMPSSVPSFHVPDVSWHQVAQLTGGGFGLRSAGEASTSVPRRSRPNPRCAVAMDTFIVFAASYDTLGAAEADYHAVRDFYLTCGLIDTYDAAVIIRDDPGKVKIVAKHEQPTRQGAWRGLGIGLVGGASWRSSPPWVSVPGCCFGGASGACLGALAGHVTAGLNRADLKDLGELLDKGTAGW